MTPELEQIAVLLRAAAREEILPRLGRTETHRKTDGSLVTPADLAVQARLAAALAQDFPERSLLGEEMEPEEQRRILADSPNGVWVLDPLDGTSNFVNGFPGFSISLALIEGGQVSLGAVLDPVRDQCFAAARGAGAFLDGKPIRSASRSGTLGDCLAMIDVKRLPAAALPMLFRPGGFGSQRSLGSVALEWCWLACGQVQLYLHGSQRLWDYAAGRLIAEEAGAAALHIGRWNGEPTQGIGLAPQHAIGAADTRLMQSWLDFLRPLRQDAQE
ncbi:inositol monophosphatase family protein [Imhoffiella purpurea]|uniref:Inositol-1-monophosphatase n=1 Tax=Imhoffiella purpurea TaxID=1249627 RepID=W9VIR7_9GAMM|nr:inositol monophosphatase [Imhoffiella purpurea]EXJ15947.1 Inositol-1-monophosphatase [Imhoffiella purpurea]